MASRSVDTCACGCGGGGSGPCWSGGGSGTSAGSWAARGATGATRGTPTPPTWEANVGSQRWGHAVGCIRQRISHDAHTRHSTSYSRRARCNVKHILAASTLSYPQ
eukprot:1744241-Pyramimonas_sp.AAC.1